MELGETVTIMARYDPLLEVCQQIGTVGKISFRVLQSGSTLELNVGAFIDRTKRIRLDIRNNLLSSQDISQSVPTLTRVYEMGQGEGVERYIEMFQTENAIESEQAFGRKIEHFKDQRNVSNEQSEAERYEELKTEAFEELLDKDAQTINALASPNEGSSLKLFKDYNLGDFVTVVFNDVEYTTQITAAAISINGIGYVEVFSVGDVLEFGESGQIASRIKQQSKRITTLERSM
jgi:hypothetical protein